MQIAQRKFEALLYDVCNSLRSISCGLGLIEAHQVYTQLSAVQDQVIDQGMTPIMFEFNVFDLLGRGQQLIEANREAIREWRREGIVV